MFAVLLRPINDISNPKDISHVTSKLLKELNSKLSWKVNPVHAILLFSL
jgi:hypothetical protein